MYLEQINQVNDIKKLDKSEWEPLAQEIREFLIEKISVTGGHLASNLGVVELTMAMHLAAAEGASCVEAYDALGGLKSLDELKRKIEAGWEKREA